MSEHLLRKGKSQRHQEDGPVDRMETNDILSDQMQVSGPQLRKLLRAVSIRIVPDPRDIVGQRVQPHIGNVLRIKVYRDSPLEGCSGYTQILKSRKKEVVHHLVLAGYRLDKLRMRVDVLDQTIRIFAHFEEICFLFRRLHLAPAVRTFPVHKLGLREERLARRTVHSFIMPLVNVSLFIQLFENLLHLLLMILVRRADEFVIRRVHQIPDALDLRGYIIYKFLWRDARLLRFQFNLLAVLICSCLEEHIVSLTPLIARDRVRQHDLVSVADMRLA